MTNQRRVPRRIDWLRVASWAIAFLSGAVVALIVGVLIALFLLTFG